MSDTQNKVRIYSLRARTVQVRGTWTKKQQLILLFNREGFTEMG